MRALGLIAMWAAASGCDAFAGTPKCREVAFSDGLTLKCGGPGPGVTVGAAGAGFMMGPPPFGHAGAGGAGAGGAGAGGSGTSGSGAGGAGGAAGEPDTMPPASDEDAGIDDDAGAEQS
jgi:hypothetical protein